MRLSDRTPSKEILIPINNILEGGDRKMTALSFLKRLSLLFKIGRYIRIQDATNKISIKGSKSKDFRFESVEVAPNGGVAQR